MSKHHPSHWSKPALALACGALVYVGSSLISAGTARAEGEQLMPGGAQAIGRGGASVARPTDNMAMLMNPAGLVELPGNQTLFQIDTSIDRLCVQPYGFYGWGVYLAEDQQGYTNNPDDHRSEFGDPASSAYGRRRLDRMCNSAEIAPLPQLAFSFHLTPDLSLAFGFIAPAMVNNAQWGGKDGTIQTEAGPRPSPTRYQFVRTEVLFALNPTASVAYRVLPWLSLGLTLQVTMVSANTYMVMAMRAGTSPSNDAMAKLHATDLFMPGMIFAAHAKPSRYLRFAGTFNWAEGLDGHGEMTITTNHYHQGANGSELLPFQNDPVKLKRVRLGLPWTATLAARFAMPRDRGKDDAKSAVNDVLVNEVWDVEIDASYTANRSVSGSNQVNVANDFTLEFRRADGTPQMPLVVKQSDIEEISVDRHTRDVLAIRLGGSFNVLPGRLQLSAGGFFQTRGVNPDYASIDNFGLQRVGLGLGVLVRLGRFDVSAAYAHVFQETLIVAPPNHQPRSAATDAPDSGFDQRIYDDNRLSQGPQPDPNLPDRANGTAKLTQSAVFESDVLRRRVVNAGRYTASFDVISVGATYHF